MNPVTSILQLAETFEDRMARENRERAEYEKATVVTTEGWTIADLRTAFDQVQNEQHWKGPIDKNVKRTTPEQRRKISKAVVFFAGCEAEWQSMGKGVWRVTAPGYWAAVGA